MESAPDLLVFIGPTYYYLNLRGTTFLIKHLRDLCKPLKRLLQEMAEAMNLEELRTHLKKLFLEGQKVEEDLGQKNTCLLTASHKRNRQASGELVLILAKRVA